jgi:hypothetical protein
VESITDSEEKIQDKAVQRRQSVHNRFIFLGLHPASFNSHKPKGILCYITEKEAQWKKTSGQNREGECPSGQSVFQNSFLVGSKKSLFHICSLLSLFKFPNVYLAVIFNCYSCVVSDMAQQRRAEVSHLRFCHCGNDREMVSRCPHPPSSYHRFFLVVILLLLMNKVF